MTTHSNYTLINLANIFTFLRAECMLKVYLSYLPISKHADRNDKKSARPRRPAHISFYINYLVRSSHARFILYIAINAWENDSLYIYI